MRKKIVPLTWKADFKNEIKLNTLSIDDDFIVFDNIKILPVFDHPFRTDVTTIIISTRGETSGRIGLHAYHSVSPCMITLLAGEILQHEHISKDFQGFFIVLSRRLSDELLPEIQAQFPLSISVRRNPLIELNPSQLNLLKTYYDMLKRIAGMKDNPHRKNIARHLMIAFYYHSNSWLHKSSEQETVITKQDELVNRFLDLAEKHYRAERQVGFYAHKLRLTPKYLSQLIKQNTGKSVNTWIDEYVILGSKELLKCSELSIQQIANELNFIDQSAFGKYFKRQTGLSPKAYRES